MDQENNNERAVVTGTIEDRMTRLELQRFFVNLANTEGTHQDQDELITNFWNRIGPIGPIDLIGPNDINQLPETRIELVDILQNERLERREMRITREDDDVTFCIGGRRRTHDIRFWLDILRGDEREIIYIPENLENMQQGMVNLFDRDLFTINGNLGIEPEGDDEVPLEDEETEDEAFCSGEDSEYEEDMSEEDDEEDISEEDSEYEEDDEEDILDADVFYEQRDMVADQLGARQGPVAQLEQNPGADVVVDGRRAEEYDADDEDMLDVGAQGVDVPEPHIHGAVNYWFQS